MREFSNPAVVILFSVGLILIIIAVGPASSSPEDMAHTQFLLQGVTRGVGFLLATIAGLRLLLQHSEGLSLDNFVVSTTVLLGGILLIEPHWAVGISFGLVVLAVITRVVLRERGLARSGDIVSSPGGDVGSGYGESGPSPEGQ